MNISFSKLIVIVCCIISFTACMGNTNKPSIDKEGEKYKYQAMLQNAYTSVLYNNFDCAAEINPDALITFYVRQVLWYEQSPNGWLGTKEISIEEIKSNLPRFFDGIIEEQYQEMYNSITYDSEKDLFIIADTIFPSIFTTIKIDNVRHDGDIVYLDYTGYSFAAVGQGTVSIQELEEGRFKILSNIFEV